MNSSNSLGHGGLSRIRQSAAAVHRTILRAVDWIRAGYPDAAPRTGHCALVALYGPQSLTGHEISRVIEALGATPDAATDTDVQTTIVKVTDRLPNPSQIAQVHRTLTQ